MDTAHWGTLQHTLGFALSSMAKKNGRPTKYRRKYATMLVEYFSKDPFKEIQVTITTAKGATITKTQLVSNQLPTFLGFAQKIKVNGDTLVEWAKGKTKSGKDKYKGFPAAYKKAKELQKWFLIENGLKGLYNPAFAIFTAKNITDMKDKQEIDHTTKGKAIKGFNYLPPAKSYGDNPDDQTNT